MKKLFIVFVVFLACFNSSYSQIKDPIIPPEKHENLRARVIVYLKTGEVYKGYFISQNRDFLEIDSETAGRVTIPTQRIKKIESAGNEVRGAGIAESVSEDINAVRYFFGTSGFNFERGKSYLRNNPMTFHRGLSDNFSIGMGSSLLLDVVGLPNLYINPHYTLPINSKLYFKAGMSAAVGAGINDGGAGGAAIFNTGLTLGNRDINLTGSYYYGVVSEVGSISFITVAGKARLARRLALISENAIFYAEDFNAYILLSYGLRYITESGSFDLGFINNTDFGEFYYIGIPFIALTLAL